MKIRAALWQHNEIPIFWNRSPKKAEGQAWDILIRVSELQGKLKFLPQHMCYAKIIVLGREELGP